MRRFLTTREIADEFGVTPETVSRWVTAGKFPNAFKRVGRWRIPIDDADAFANAADREDEKDDDN